MAEDEPAKDVTQKVTDADYKQQEIDNQRLADFSARQALEPAQQTGLFGKMFVDPNAARELPQSEGARILAMGRSGIALLNGTTPEFPFAAYAQQHLPNVAPSLNTKMMEQAIGRYAQEGKADPRVENSLHKMVSDDLLPEAYALGEKYPHDFANILNGYVRNPEQEKDYLKFKEKADAIQTLRDNSLLLPEFLKKLDGDAQKSGLVTSPELQKSISDYYRYMDDTIGRGGMEDDAIKEQKQLLDKLHGYSALDEMVKKVLPSKDAVLKETQVAPATYLDPKTGKQVPIANTFAENNYDNPQTQQMKDDLTKRADLILSGADDDEKSALAKQLGSKKDDESIRSGLVNYMYSILPKGGSTTLHNEQKPNNTYINMVAEPQTPFNTAGNLVSKGVGDLSTSKDVFSGLENKSITFQTKSGPKSVSFKQMFEEFRPTKSTGYQEGVQAAEFKLNKENLSPEKVNSYDFKQAVLPNSFDENGNMLDDTQINQMMFDPKAAIKSQDESKLSLSDVSLVFGADVDPDRGYQPTKFAKEKMTGEEMNNDQYQPYYRFAYKLVDKDGKSHVIYHYGSVNNPEKTRGYDAVLLTEGAAKDIENIKGQ